MPRGKGKAEEETGRGAAGPGGAQRGSRRAHPYSRPLLAQLRENTDHTTEGTRHLALREHLLCTLAKSFRKSQAHRDKACYILYVDGKLRQGKMKVLAQGHPAKQVTARFKARPAGSKPAFSLRALGRLVEVGGWGNAG